MENFEVGKLFLKIDINKKNFGLNIGTKIFLVGKLGHKVDLRGQVQSRKIRVKNFSSIFQFGDKFQIFNFSGEIFCGKIS